MTLSAACFSPDGVHRYTLHRAWDAGLPAVCWIMLNPSTADAEKDDPTVAKCTRFSEAWGFGGLVVVNLFALRSTDPKLLYLHRDPVGVDNDEHIAREAHAAGQVVGAWGGHGVYRNRGMLVLDRVIPDLVVWRLDYPLASGQPRHPLYTKNTTKPVVHRQPA